ESIRAEEKCVEDFSKEDDETLEAETEDSLFVQKETVDTDDVTCSLPSFSLGIDLELSHTKLMMTRMRG
ncbi:hypothetical protein LINPERPRIM_LOCUS13307, partial [Linum perenne]